MNINSLKIFSVISILLLVLNACAKPNIKTNKKITISILKPIKPGLQKEAFLKVLEKKIYDELDLIC